MAEQEQGWKKAAAESHRKDVSEERNNRTRKYFEAAIEEDRID